MCFYPFLLLFIFLISEGRTEKYILKVRSEGGFPLVFFSSVKKRKREIKLSPTSRVNNTFVRKVYTLVQFLFVQLSGYNYWPQKINPDP